MNYADYQDKRNELLDKAEDLINKGNTVDSEKVLAEIETLDKNLANERAMNKSSRVTDIYRNSVNVIGGKVIDRIGGNESMDKRLTDDYKESFIKTLQGNGTVEMSNLVTSTTGAAVIPTTTFNEIIQNLQKQQGLLSRVRVLQIPGKLSIPLSDINTPAAWHTEGEEIGDSSVVPTNIVLGGYELAKLFSMSAATKSMSVPEYENYLINELQRTTGDALNDVIFTGDGTGKPLGLMNLTYDVSNSLTYTEATIYDTLIKALGLLSSNFRQGASWIMNSTTYYSVVLAAKDSTGKPIFSQDLSSVVPLRILGKEVIIDDFTPDDTILFGDPSYYFLNFSEPMAVEKSTEAGFTKGVTMYRSIAVVDGKPLPTGAFIKITKTV